jgi:hypothetical protein
MLGAVASCYTSCAVKNFIRRNIVLLVGGKAIIVPILRKIGKLIMM